MLFIGSKVKVIDNTAAKVAKCIRIIKPTSMFSNRVFKLGFIMVVVNKVVLFLHFMIM